MIRARRSAWPAVGVLACLACGVQAEQPLPFADGRWDLKGSGIAVVQADGRDALAVETGIAYRREVKLEDGTLDFDVQLTRRRSFVYVMFRMQADHEHEEIYLRPHKSGLPDALQYAPVWQGQSGWQLHHGPGATAAVAFEPGAWTHVRLVLKGRSAALFVGDMAVPALLVPRLAREPAPGYVGLRGFLPAGTPGEGPVARYANVSARPGEVSFDFAGAAPAAAPSPNAGVVRAWAVSRAFVPPKPGPGADLWLPAPPELGELRRVEAAADGLVELHRSISLPAGSRAAAAVARVHVRAAQAGARAFDLGFSDVVTLYLNGTPLLHVDQSYSYDTPRREGLIGYDQARVYLPLRAGDNELVLAVSDSFGGWGLMGRFPDAAGLEVEAR